MEKSDISNLKNKFENIIIGAGPAGLTAGFELARNNREVLVLESDKKYVGGIARTVNYKGFKFDIGGHRFFTKSEKVKELWKDLLESSNWRYGVPRLSRIYFERKFFSYPLKAFETLINLGVGRSIYYIASYLYYKVFPIKDVKSFEDWVINNFGKQLYLAFFKTYTEKVWGIPCNEISADWAAQRIKGLSLIEAIKNAFNELRPKKKINSGKIIKTLIDNFDYPKSGPGMLWENAAKKINSFGSEVLLGSKVTKLYCENLSIKFCEINDGQKIFSGKNFISTLPIKKLISILEPTPPSQILNAGSKLKYRDFLTVVLILNKKDVFPDNWIYIHEPNVKLGRIQNFKNWSEDMIPNDLQTSLGLEYFCLEGDELWNMPDQELIEFGLKELVKIGIASKELFVDGTVVRMPKAYPVYDEQYKENLSLIKKWLDMNINNLQLVGRNGMHMYNNQDHSMLSAFYAARNLMGEKWDPWLVNADAEYHEEDTKSQVGRMVPKRLGS